MADISPTSASKVTDLDTSKHLEIDQMAESKSMENILLETTSLDESMNIEGRSPSRQSNAAVSPMTVDDESPLKVQFAMGEEGKREDEALEYFKGSEVTEEGEEEQEEIEDEEEGREEEEEEAEKKEEEEEEETAEVKKPHLHFSISREEDVSFEEEKGEGLKPTMSTRSLSKFFTTEVGGTDSDGKSFFDAFTAGEAEDPLALSSRLENRERALSGSSETPSSPAKSLPPDSTVFSADLASARPHTTSISEDALFLRSDSAHSESDVFSASLKASEADRQRDAWIPSEPTRLALVNLLTSTQGSYTVPHEQLTLPGLINDDPQGDPVKDLVQKFISDHEASNRKTLSAADVLQDEDGLQQLMNAECWRAAIDLTGIILAQCGQGMGQVGQPSAHSPCSLRVWMLRMSLLIKLQQFSLAESECQAFGSMDTPDLYYEYYFDQYPGRRGSMVPFEFRVICAELPQYLGKSQESLDRLYYLYAIAGKILENLLQGLAEDGSMLQLSDSNREASTKLWMSREIRLLYAISNCALNIKDYQTAIEVLEDLLIKDIPHKVHLWSGIARTYLQMGDLKSGMHYIDLVSADIDPEDAQFNCMNHINRGFLAIGQNNFPEAQQSFQKALDYEPKNVIAVNNMAVCYLYMGQLKEALNALEGLVQESPHLHLQEGLLFNLSTLYELQSSRAMNKKQTLLDLVSKYKGNGFNVACLKMT